MKKSLSIVNILKEMGSRNKKRMRVPVGDVQNANNNSQVQQKQQPNQQAQAQNTAVTKNVEALARLARSAGRAPRGTRRASVATCSCCGHAKLDFAGEDRMVFGTLEIDVPRHRVLVDDEEVPLTALEFKLLYDLASRRGRVQSRDALLERVWGYAPGIETRTVDTHVKRLREKLGSARDTIETVRGVGYRMRDAAASARTPARQALRHRKAYQQGGQVWQPPESGGPTTLAQARDRVGLTDEEMHYFLRPELSQVKKNLVKDPETGEMTLVLPSNVYQSLEKKIEGFGQGGQIEDFVMWLQKIAPNMIDTNIAVIESENETRWPTQQGNNPFGQFE